MGSVTNLSIDVAGFHNDRIFVVILLIDVVEFPHEKQRLFILTTHAIDVLWFRNDTVGFCNYS